MDQSTVNCPVSLWKQTLAALVPVGFCLFEIGQWWNWPDRDRTWTNLLFATQTGLYMVWLTAFPLVFLFGKWTILGWKKRTGPQRANSSLPPFFLCWILGTAIACGFGWPVRDLPAAYHDEYSYLFQAQTFLSGRCHYDPPLQAELFQQVHVLTSPVFASRYFPGTGLYLLPFVWAGFPVAGIWLCHGLVAGFSAAVGCQFSRGTGWIAGLTVACAPGMVLLGNLLLSPMPTMLGMAVFYWAYFRMFETCRLRWAVLAGGAIGFAFLTRPLTAVGLGYPFAFYALYRLMKNPPVLGARNYSKCLAALILSFSTSVLAMGTYNHQLTGTPFTSPYGLYTAKHTPSHVFGFYNRTRGEKQRGEQTHTAYDDWSEDLTPTRAAELVRGRLWGLVRWSLGVIPVLSLLVLLAATCKQWDDRVLLLLLSVLGLVLVYAPFGHPGMFDWGYLFEAMPPLLLCLAIAGGRLSSDWQHRGRPLVGLWWQGIWAIALGINLFQQIPAVFAPGSEMVHPRQVAAIQRKREEAASRRGPILVLVVADPKESVHSTYVHNRPSLDGPVVRAWFRDNEQSELLMRQFPDRAVYLYRPATDTWQQIR